MDYALRDELLRAILADNADELARLVAIGAEIGADPRHGNTAMKTASQSGSVRCIRALIALGANVNERITYRSPVDKRVEQDFTPLFYASEPGVIVTLAESGADINAVSSTGLSALMRFAHFGRAKHVEIMLRLGADASLRQNPKRGRKAQTALELAQESLKEWEKISMDALKPEAHDIIEQLRDTVRLLLAASAS
jgi:ankyrin repeat protein